MSELAEQAGRHDGGGDLGVLPVRGPGEQVVADEQCGCGIVIAAGR